MPTAKAREAMAGKDTSHSSAAGNGACPEPDADIPAGNGACPEPDADIATDSPSLEASRPGRQVEVADCAKGPITDPVFITPSERPVPREVVMQDATVAVSDHHLDDVHKGKKVHPPLVVSAAERGDGPSPKQAEARIASGSGRLKLTGSAHQAQPGQPHVEPQLQKPNRFSRRVAPRASSASEHRALCDTGTLTGIANCIPSSRRSVPGNSRWPSPGQSPDVPLRLETPERLVIRLNEFKVVSESLRRDKEVAYEHLDLVKAKLKEAEDTIVRLNSQVEASRKLVVNLRENPPVSGALSHPAGDSVIGVKKALRKRKSFKATLEKLRVAVVNKMGEKLSGVDTLQTKVGERVQCRDKQLACVMSLT